MAEAKLDMAYCSMLIVLVLCLIILSSGCSVGMAMVGKKEPNLGAVQVGATRGEVELQLGNAISSVTTEEGRRVDLYEYEIGNEPSGGRAIGHAVMDLLTLGVWEIIGTPIEAVQGKKYQISIAYGPDDRVLAINKPITSLPPQKKEAVAETKPQKIESKIPAKEIQGIEQRLDYIQALKEKGKINDEEYKKMRKEILSGTDKPSNGQPSKTLIKTENPAIIEGK